ncbi:MAG TPA: metalloregulator ArsR/SmtB family transcription factor [Candidatus Peribacteria bacterium]|nr:metalloregulator ArsR/SmtB family transcription factor [Candidatus Peribacteria bacterium]
MVKYDSLSLVFRALESPARRKILEGIALKHQNVQELAKPLGISLPAVSRHLKILEEANLIKRHKAQRFYYFELNLEPLDEAQVWIDTHKTFWKQKLTSLRDYLSSHSIS